MNKILVICSIVLLLISGCGKSGINGFDPGKYEGNFYRSCGPSEFCVIYPEPTFELSLVSGKFRAQSLDARFNAKTCEGIFTKQGDSLYFSNNCSLDSADDPSMSLQGAYEIRYANSDSLFFRRSLDLANPEYPVDGYYLKRVGDK